MQGMIGDCREPAGFANLNPMLRLGLSIAPVLAALALSSSAAAQLPYKNPALSVDARVRDLLARMTLEEKFWQLYMIPGGRENPAHDYSHGVFGLQNRGAMTGRADAELQNGLQHYFVDSTRLGIPIIPFEEAVHGLMRRGATVYPAAIALAATFDSTLVDSVATAIAREARSRGIRQVLSPVVNIVSDVRWGRVEETYGEDPLLASVMARAFVRAFEERGVITTPKHFVANVGEGGRDSYPIDVSERSLRERYFPPFRAALDAGAGSVMTAYNSVNGLPATQNPTLLDSTLRRSWGFKGFIISDQSAVGGSVVLHHTDATTAAATQRALEAGLDVIFQSSYDQYRPYLEALRNGLVPRAVIDSAVARVLRAKFTLGLFERPYVDPDTAARLNGSEDARALAREAARASIVLLKNDGHVLPLAARVGSVALIGADAAEPRLGGYTLDDARGVSILDALRDRLGDRVKYEAGPGRSAASSVAVPAASFDVLQGEYYDNIALAGVARVSRRDAAVDFRWTFNAPARGIATDWYSVRWTGRVRVPPSGVRRIGVEGDDGYRLYVDDKLLIDDWRKQSFGTRLAPVMFAPGSIHDIRLEFSHAGGSGGARVRLVWDRGVNESEARIDSAVALARRSDVAIIVAGIEEGEFRDRASLALPGLQEELIARVADAGRPVIVVLVGGSAITMSRWLDRAGAVLMAWYAGAEGGRAVTDVLLGANPGGRLPITFPVAEGQLPLVYNHGPTGRGDDYVDLTGKPAFPFGFGLSYTTFEYGDLRIEPQTIGPTGTAKVSFTLRNSGAVAGDEIPQLYIRHVVSSVVQPVLSLGAFTRIRLAPGEARTVTFAIGPRDLRILDARRRWIVEPGTTRIFVGASSNDLRLRGDLVVSR